jgi:hypothetical protein
MAFLSAKRRGTAPPLLAIPAQQRKMAQSNRQVTLARSAVNRRCHVSSAVLRTHPRVIVGGILRENPFYVPPDEFLRDLQD